MLTDDDGPEDDLGPPDPAADLPDPDESIPDPAEELPNVPDSTKPMAEIPGDLLRAFWSTVLLFNLALLALSLGAMLIAFDVRRQLGVGLFAVGVFALVRGYLKYRKYEGREWSD